MEPKNKFFCVTRIFFYLRISFQVCYGYMKKVTTSLDVKFIIFHLLEHLGVLYKLHFLHNFLNKLTKSNILIFNGPLSLWKVVKQIKKTG